MELWQEARKIATFDPKQQGVSVGGARASGKRRRDHLLGYRDKSAILLFLQERLFTKLVETGRTEAESRE